VPVVIEKITEERHWRNVWLERHKKIMLRVESPVMFMDDKDEIKFSEHIIIHDFAGDFSDVIIGDLLIAKIGYADQNQQYYHRVNAFSVSILKQEKLMQPVH